MKQNVRKINGLLLIFMPFFAYFINELAYNPTYSDIGALKLLGNYLVWFGIQAGLLLFFRNCKRSFCVLICLSWILGLINYFVLKFKGNPLQPNDLFSLQAAIDVASNYDFTLSGAVVKAFLLALALMCLVISLPGSKQKRTTRQRLISLGTGIAYTFIFAMLLLQINWSYLFKIATDPWEPKNIYFKNGYFITFLSDARSMKVSAPDNYSAKEAREVLSFHTVTLEDEEKSISPSVIVIMNESFADLKILNEFESEDYLSNWNGMSSFVKKGNVYTSVIGGGTCNSEFEFLTGNSMGNFAGTVYPYQMFSMKNVPNLASAFAEKGYETIAIHPAAQNNWNRNTVYQQLGFKQFISLEDMTNVQNIRYYPSDAYNYEQIITQYEKNDSPKFIFNITMQNHGGYTGKPDNLDPITIEPAYNQYQDVITYLTLIKESDQAFARFLSYFAQKAEPVIICMFGDHQPALDQSFLTQLQGESKDTKTLQKRYATPYVIFSNFDLGCSNIIQDMSVNYLGANILDLAGISTPYSRYLLALQQEIPVINQQGYQTASGQWHTIETPNNFVSQYRTLQYYMMFDGK